MWLSMNSEKQKEKMTMPTAESTLPGRDHKMAHAATHFVLKSPISGPFPDSYESILFGMGCFWGAERKFWNLEGVYSTAVGYSAGYTPNPTYEEVCSGKTGHNEVVLVVFDSLKLPLAKLLAVFWESHLPTQGMRQGNDIGTQYRSGIYVSSADMLVQAEDSRGQYQAALDRKKLGQITTEIALASEFYYAEDYHQQYLAKNPNGYCGIGGCGVLMPSD